MHHIAIMKKSWGLTEKILDGRKKIESRWYMSKCAPWGKIASGDTVYFKNSGEPVTVRAEVEKVVTFVDLTPKKVLEILCDYGADDGIEKKEAARYFDLFKNKKYCLLIYLKNPQKITPFQIDKTGFGAMAAWMCVNDMRSVKKQ